MRKESFLWRVKLREGRHHSLKHHARRGTAIYELLGYLDLLARKDPQRFVFASLKAVVGGCNKGARRDGEHYTLSHLKGELAELRARRIVGPYFATVDGRYGFIVAPHDSLCHVVDGVCIMHAPRLGEYECFPEDLALFQANLTAPPVHSTGKTALLNTGAKPTGNRLGPEKDTKRIFTRVPANGIEDTQEDTQKGTGQVPQPIDWHAVECANIESWNAFGLENGAPNRQNRAYPSEPSDPKSITGEAVEPEKRDGALERF